MKKILYILFIAFLCFLGACSPHAYSGAHRADKKVKKNYRHSEKGKKEVKKTAHHHLKKTEHDAQKMQEKLNEQQAASKSKTTKSGRTTVNDGTFDFY